MEKASLQEELRKIDRRLGWLWDTPTMQKAPQYVRAELTEIRDQIMKVAKEYAPKV
jgi:hypothetical protein